MKKKCFYFYFYFTQLNGSNHVMYLFLQRESLFYYQLTNSLHKIIVSSNIEQKMNSVIILACVNLSNYATHQLSQYRLTTFTYGNNMFMIRFFGTFVVGDAFVGDKADSKYFDATVMGNNSLKSFVTIFFFSLFYHKKDRKVLNISIFTSCTVDIPTQSAPRSFNSRASATVS